MIHHVNGFNLEVTMPKFQLEVPAPRVRISFGDGTVVVDTDALSIEGMRNMSAVFEAAASIAFRELDNHYAIEHARHRRNDR